MHYNRDFGIECRIARFHNIYGPHGTWKGGREKAPAAFCRKVCCVALRVGVCCIRHWDCFFLCCTSTCGYPLVVAAGACWVLSCAAAAAPVLC
jgi:hypothetical protein